MAPPVLAFRIRQALEGTSMGPVAGVPRPAAADTGASRPALGGLSALMQFTEREHVFEALRQSSLVECSRHALKQAA